MSKTTSLRELPPGSAWNEAMKRETSLWKSSIFILVAAAAALVAVEYVQNRVVPGRLEIAIRTSDNVLGFLAVPLLLLLGCATWVKKTREKLSIWRNGLSLSSIVLLSCAWMVDFAARFASTIHPHQGSFFNLDWLATILYSTLVAALLAIALKGTARLLILSAAILMFAGLQARVYF
jgi:hypothetical protein